MKLIGHFLAVLLATVLALSVSAYIFGHTLWSAPYLERQASQTNLYPSLATQLPLTFAAAGSGTPAGATLNPALLQSQFTDLIPQLITHIHQSGPPPTIDLGAFSTAIGQPPPDGALTGQLTLGTADSKLVGTMHLLSTAGQSAPLAAIVLIVLIIVLTGHRRLPTLARACFETTAALIVSGGLFWLLPYLLYGALAKPTLTPIRTAIWPFLTAVTRDIGTQFVIAAAAFFIVGVGLILARSAAGLIARLTPKPKIPPAPLPPSPGMNRL